MGGGRRWSSVGSGFQQREKGEEGKIRIGMGSQRGGWVLGEGGESRGVREINKCGGQVWLCVGGVGGGTSGQVWGTSVGVCGGGGESKEREEEEAVGLGGGFQTWKGGGGGGGVGDKCGGQVGWGVQPVWKERTLNRGVWNSGDV